MARETKVGLLIGLGVILLVGIIISDHLAVTRPQPAEAAGTRAITDFAQQAQDGIHPDTPEPTRSDETLAAPPRDTNTDAAANDAGRNAAPRGSGTPRLLDSDRFAEPELAPPDQRRPETQSAEAPTRLADLPAPPTAWRRTPLPEDAAPQGDPNASASADAQNTTTPDPADVPEVAPVDDVAGPVPAPHRRTGAELVHYVERNDTLAELANRYYGDSAYQGSIAAVNRGALAPDGSLIPGTRLIIPNRAGHVSTDVGSNGSTDLIASGLFEPVPGINARGEAPGTVLPVTAAAEQQRAAQQSAATVEVLPGDSLSKLAERHLGSSARYQELFEANRDQLDSPDRVVVGMKLRLPAGSGNTAAQAVAEQPRDDASGPADQPAPPARAAARTYTVQPGDNLSRIAEKALGDRNRWRELYEANQDRLDSPDRVTIGQELRLPS